MTIITNMDLPATCSACPMCSNGLQGGRLYPYYCHLQRKALSPAVETKRDSGCTLMEPPGFYRDEDLLPPVGETVWIARTTGKAGDLKVEQGELTEKGTFRVKGSNVKKIIGWLPLSATEKG